MAKNLGRIAKLKDSIDTLTYVTNAIATIKTETGVDWDDNPSQALTKARAKLKELKEE